MRMILGVNLKDGKIWKLPPQNEKNIHKKCNCDFL